MAFHIIVIDDDKTVVTNVDTDAIALAYHSEDGINGQTMLDCNGRTTFHLLMSLDELREHILRDNPGMRYLYDHRNEIIDSKVEIDIGAIRRAMMGDDEDE